MTAGGKVARRMRVAIPASIERVDHKAMGRLSVTICSLSVTDVGIRYPVRMAIGEEFTITFAGSFPSRRGRCTRSRKEC